jgi:ribosome assembly protein 1
VDHGKTSLADSLVEYNGIISERLAGTMRFLDSLEEEQRRGITIKSSAIALKHSYIPPPSAANSDKVNTETDMVIHILDSPGHVDFAVEVTAALQVCDGALLLVDVIEGMCARTHSILREAFSMSLTPILVLNKIDRLCTELKLSPNEAYVRIRHVIESVNAATSNIIRSSLADCVEHNPIDMQETQEQSSSYHQEKELVWTFEPSKGNGRLDIQQDTYVITIKPIYHHLPPFHHTRCIIIQLYLRRHSLDGDLLYPV